MALPLAQGSVDPTGSVNPTGGRDSFGPRSFLARKNAFHYTNSLALALSLCYGNETLALGVWASQQDSCIQDSQHKRDW